MIEIVFWFERGRTDSAVARTWDGDRFHTGTGRDFLAAIADCIRERLTAKAPGLVPPPIGRDRCGACEGVGQCNLERCHVCDGVGHVWRAGGPRFGAPLELGEREAGEIVELATGHRARIRWHMPRPTRRVRAEATFVTLIDDFDGTEDTTPIPVDSRVGVVSVAHERKIVDDDAHAGEKDADIVDPIAARARAAAGPLL